MGINAAVQIETPDVFVLAEVEDIGRGKEYLDRDLRPLRAQYRDQVAR